MPEGAAISAAEIITLPTAVMDVRDRATAAFVEMAEASAAAVQPAAGPSLWSAGRSRRGARFANLFANPRIRANRPPPLRSDGRQVAERPISRRVGGASFVMDMNI